jgi:hypothetical protein
MRVIAAHARLVAVRMCLERHISPILVTSVINSALRKRGLTEEALSVDDLEGLVEEAMVGLRLFVDARELPQVMVELSIILAGSES